MKLCRGAVARTVLTVAAVLLLTACAAKDTSPDMDPQSDSEVITAGRGIGTDLRPVIFDGQVVYRSNGELLPRSDVTFKRHELPDREPYVIEITVDEDGRFESELLLVTTVVGRRRLKRGTTVIIESPSCSSVRIDVGDDWKSRIIELECDVE